MLNNYNYKAQLNSFILKEDLEIDNTYKQVYSNGWFMFVLGLLFFLFGTNFHAQQLIKGKIVENDSNTAVPFVYIIAKSNGNGTMSDNDGNFSLLLNQEDTLVFSCIGFTKLVIPFKNLFKTSTNSYKVIMTKMLINLNMIVVTSFKIKPYERDYMNKIIDESKIKALDYSTSPISALYMRYSKEGKQIRKLARIFEDLLIEEQVQKKFSPDILRKLTGDDKIDYHAFRKYCYTCNNQYIITHDGADLYGRIMECYKRWRSEKNK
jgi:hypothetical protein